MTRNWVAGSIAALALSLAAGRSDAAASSYVVSARDAVIGAMNVKGVGANRQIIFGFSTNGRGPQQSTELRLDADGRPERLSVTGVDVLQVSVTETLEPDGRNLRWHTDVDSGEGPAGGFYLPFHESPEIYALLARVLLRTPGRTVRLLPTGKAMVTTSVERTVRRGAESLVVRLVFIDGVAFAPQPVWLTTGDRLFAMVTESGLSTVQKGWESVRHELAIAQQEALDARDIEQARRFAPTPTEPILISHARLFDSETRTMRPGTSVLIDGNRIAAVGPDGSVKVPPNARQIDASGGTVLPGLWDMHVHLQSNTDGMLHIANGVTSVRDMGNDVAAATGWRRRFASGELIGPRLMLAGLIDGTGRTASTGGVQIDSAEGASRAITMFADCGYDEIKIYSSFPVSLLPEAIAQAKSRGLRVGGHVPAGLRMADVVRMGFTDVSHLNFLLLNFLGDDVQSKTNTLARMTVPAEQAASIDVTSQPVRDLIADMHSRGVVFDVTSVVLEHLFTGAPGTMSREIAAYGDRLPPTVLRNGRAGGLAKSDTQRATYTKSFRRALELLKAVHDGGAQIVPGTDGLAGILLPRELELYVEAGIPPLDVLQIATLGPARMMKRDGDLGSIAPGKLADLIVTDGDPSVDMSRIRALRWVFKDGRVIDLAALDKSLGILPAPLPARVALSAPR
jgi:Amidohydrolase family